MKEEISEGENVHNPQDVTINLWAANAHTKKEHDCNEHSNISSDDFQVRNDLQTYLISSKPQNTRNSVSETKKKHNKRAKATETSEGKFYPCHYCSKVFGSNKLRSNHNSRVHDKCRPHKCEICGRGFYNSTGIRLHMRTHTGEKPYVCQNCGKGFIYPYCLSRHVQKVRCHKKAKEKLGEEFVQFLQNGLKRYKCTECHLVFARIDRLRLHVQAEHDLEKPYECHLCGHSFSIKDRLRKHVRSVHSGPNLYHCRFCRKRCLNTRTLSSHLRTHGEDLFICSTCPYSTFAEKNFRKHNKKAHGVNGEGVTVKSEQLLVKKADYGLVKGSNDESSGESKSENVFDASAASCSAFDNENEREDSSRRLSKSEYLRKSELVPEEFRTLKVERRYRCRLCNKIYAQSHHLEIHLRTHQEEAFSCELCSYSTGIKSNLEQHEATTHWIVKRGEKVTPPTFRFILDGKNLFATAVHAGRGVENHCCKICASNFYSAEELCVHYTRCHKLPAVILRNLW